MPVSGQNPIVAAGPALAQVSSAKAVCGRCPVQPNCLSYALITRPDGIWGGTTKEERWTGLQPPGRTTSMAITRVRGAWFCTGWRPI